MKRESSGPILTTVFVDYDNIYLSLKRKSEDAAKRFAKDSAVWLQGLVSGELITPTSSLLPPAERRIAMNRCYGNPVPRRNAHDNSTDMNSFPFIRHHFLRSGCEVIDCPPLTAQLKNSADIRIVMDIRDILTHDTFFDEFIILSGDADFTPVLHRLRAHARRTVVFANDHTAQPYTALSDGEVRESNLIALLLNSAQTLSQPEGNTREIAAPRQMPVIDVEAARRAILTEVVGFVRSAPQAVPLETLADRAVRIVGHDKTVGTQWGGFGTFRELLLTGLPEDIHLSDSPPYTVFDANRHITSTGLLIPQLPAALIEETPAPAQRAFQPAPPPRAAAMQQQPTKQTYQQLAQPPMLPPQSSPYKQAAEAAPALQPAAHYNDAMQARPQQAPSQQQPMQQGTAAHAPAPQAPSAPAAMTTAMPQQPAAQASFMPQQQPAPQQMTTSQPAMDVRREPMMPRQQTVQSAPTQPRTADQATQIQQSIARIHDACRAPALAPAEYRVLFDVMAQEISANGLQGAQTLANISQRAREFGLDLKRDDLRFILEVVSESDPWFEQGATAGLFAGRFRNFVVSKCRGQGLALSADELDLIEAWFAAQPALQQNHAPAYGRATTQPAPQAQPQQAAPQQQPAAGAPSGERWWSLEEGRQHIAEQRAQSGFNAPEQEDEFPRIVRTRLRG
ncbi:MAG: NYN domain-containing protein [Hyphomicrobium sp.]